MRSTRATDPEVSGLWVQIDPPPTTLNLSDELVELPTVLVSPPAHLALPLNTPGVARRPDRVPTRSPLLAASA
jgi:hypothetical protein